MRIRLTASSTIVCLSLALLAAAPLPAQEKGESKSELALKSRSTAPAANAIDANVSIDSLLAKGAETDWSAAKGARLEGYVIQVEREEDGDMHVALASKAKEPDSSKWIITEVTPAWQKKNRALGTKKVQSLNGKHVRVTGWFYYERESAQPDPRGTRWELHPVTDIEILD
jgi:hypothetical protein